MCRSRLWLLYWVSTQILLMPALTRFDSAKSTSRYRPPNGTADFALSSVRGASRLPAAPARTMPMTRRFANLPTSRGVPRSGSAKPVDQVLLQFPQPRGQLVAETAEKLRDLVRLQLPGLPVHRKQQVQVSLADLESVEVQRARRGQQPDRRLGRLGLTQQSLHDPLQHADVLAEARPHEPARGILAEPVDVVQPRQLGRVRRGRAERQPVPEVVAHVV